MTALFINVQVDDSVANNPELTNKLAEVCPVGIFYSEENEDFRLVEDNMDECVLCELCINAAPEGTVKVIKLYENQ